MVQSSTDREPSSWPQHFHYLGGNLYSLCLDFWDSLRSPDNLCCWWARASGWAGGRRCRRWLRTSVGFPPGPVSEEQDPLSQREEVKREVRVLLNIGYDRRQRSDSTLEKLSQEISIDREKDTAFFKAFLKHIDFLGGRWRISKAARARKGLPLISLMRNGFLKLNPLLVAP